MPEAQNERNVEDEVFGDLFEDEETQTEMRREERADERDERMMDEDAQAREHSKEDVTTTSDTPKAEALQGEIEEEEGQKAKPITQPRKPSRAEVEEHELTHIPYRN
eukprot:8380868-Karenia_brevis.AAC.1